MVDITPARTGSRRGPGRPSHEDVQELQSYLIAAAFNAFTRDGYGATSMASLARAAGVSKTTLYSKFPTKAALFRAIVDKQGEEAYRLLRDVKRMRRKTLALSLANMAEKALFAALAPEVLKITKLIEWESERFPELAAAAYARARLGIDIMSSYIRDFAERDEIACDDPDSAAELFNYSVRGLYHVLIMEGVMPERVKLRAKIDRLVRAFLASRADW